MPYTIVKSNGGFKVKSPHRTYSKKPLTYALAVRQLKAIKANTKEKGV